MRGDAEIGFDEHAHNSIQEGAKIAAANGAKLNENIALYASAVKELAAKRGAQFTPQGTLRWPLPSAKAEDVLSETRALLDALDTAK